MSQANNTNRPRKKSTNPFDSSDSESSLDDGFHECVDDIHGQGDLKTTATATKRSAPLNFDFKTTQTAEPALKFDVTDKDQSNEFFSPLESAILEWSGIEKPNTLSRSSSSLPDEESSEDNRIGQVNRKVDVTLMKEGPQWARLASKTSSTLDGDRRKNPDIFYVAESERLSRSGSRSSFRSARSECSDGDDTSRTETSVLTPSPGRRRRRRKHSDEVDSGVGSVASITKRSNGKHRSAAIANRSTIKPKKLSPVLETLASYEKDNEFAMDPTGTPWTKAILLEELGTASSWAILLLPYIAFVICVIFDTHTSLLMTLLDPLNASLSCVNTTSAAGYDVPLQPPPLESCSYPFILQTGQGVLAHGKKSYLFQTYHYGELMSNGTAFASAPINNISPMSSYLHGDAFFTNVPTDGVALVARGMVMSSTVVMQRTVGASSQWVPVFVSKPERLSMVCTPTDNSLRPTASSLWDCTSPRIMDVIFPMPGTGILSGGELQVNVLYSYYEASYYADWNPLKSFPSDDLDDMTAAVPFVYSEAPGTSALLATVNIADEAEIINTIVTLSSYSVEHESLTYAMLKIVVRLSALVVTFLFTVFWCWSLGSKGYFASGNAQSCCVVNWFMPRHHEDILPLRAVRRGSSMWWESSWILFPERRYLLLVLICLMLIQNPILAYVYFHPVLYSSPGVRKAADAMIGIGVHGILMSWLALMQGLRYHTAVLARRRAKHQRQVLELRKAAKYMTKADCGDYGTDERVSRYTDEFYSQYGDVDGSGTVGSLHIRLQHDPCGDSWADFLLPKLLLFVMGSISVLVTVFCRFPSTADNAATLSNQALHNYNVLYVASSFGQIFILVLWVLLIVRNSFVTGARLRKEPFLSTRPAQLAYRILLGILCLALGALVIPFLFDFYKLIAKWTLGQGVHQTGQTGKVDQDQKASTLDILLKVLVHASKRFPYSGTASSIGPGKIIFATTCAMIAAFIFLPSRSFYESESDAIKKEVKRNVNGDDNMFSPLAITQRVRQRRDKRLVVTLARYTRTWRIFPLPIKRVKVGEKLLSESSFLLDSSQRSIIYFGRYTPVFCLEIACWLLEASWQAYYSAKDFCFDDFAPGRMSLGNIGLRLEHAIYDESTHTQAYIASNLADQVDGEEDSIIVVAFRGTANSRNMQTDLKTRQVPLLEQIMGMDERATFQVLSDRIDAYDTGGWFWDTPSTEADNIQSFSPTKSPDGEPTPMRWYCDKQSKFSTVSSGAKAVIRATPMARQTLPCVHEGFLEAYSHIRQQLMEGVLQLLQRQFSKAVTRTRLSAETENNVPLALPKIYITGHSLGGSLGQLLALDIASNCELVVDIEASTSNDVGPSGELFHLPTPPQYASSFSSPENNGKERRPFFSFDDAENADSTKSRTMHLQPPIAVYTYGQPRVGNHAFARLYKQRVPHTFRVANEGDAFTAMPSFVMCAGFYKHAGLEVMLDEGCTGNTLVGPTVVETLFRFSKVRTSVAAHSMERYRDCLESALGQDELEEYYRGHGTLKEARVASDPYASRAGTTTTILPEWLTHVKRSAPRS